MQEAPSIRRRQKDGHFVVEISTDDIKRFNKAETLDEIINEARLDYALGRYKTFASAKDLIVELRS